MLRFVVRHTNRESIAVATAHGDKYLLPFRGAAAKLLSTLANYPTDDSKLPAIDLWAEVDSNLVMEPSGVSDPLPALALSTDIGARV